MTLPHRRAAVALLAIPALALCTAVATPAVAQTHVTTPKEEFGHNFGDDYFLANYKQIAAYWQKLARESNRIVLHDMGKTPEGRTQYMAIVTSPASSALPMPSDHLQKFLAIALELHLPDAVHPCHLVERRRPAAGHVE